MLQTEISLSADGQKQTVKDSAASRQTHTKTNGVQVDREASRQSKKREKKTEIEYQADIHTNRWVGRQASRQTEAGRLAHADNEMHPHRNNF